MLPLPKVAKANIIIALGGRFHGQEMAEALLKIGHGVEVHSTFPRSKFPRLPKEIVHPHLLPEFVFRILRTIGFDSRGALLKAKLFGKQLENSVAALHSRPDLFIVWSSFGLESLRKKVAPIQIIERDSTHISHQIRVLRQAYEFLGFRFPDHSEIEERELEEYDLADYIVVLSETAAGTFLDNGIPARKIFVQNGGADLTRFSPRKQERTSGPLRVVYFGSISIRKGVYYLLEATKQFAPSELTLTLIGDVDPEMRSVLTRYSHATYRKAMSHNELAPFLKSQDVFVCPSLEDGFGFVVPQAMASGLVPIVTSAMGASNLIETAINGFVVKSADSTAIQHALRALLSDSSKLSSLRTQLLKSTTDLSWKKYSVNFSTWIDKLLSKEKPHVTTENDRATYRPLNPTL